MICVTTFSQTGYEDYGRNFLESYVKYWPCKIIVYHEGHEPDFQHEKIEYRHFFDIPHTMTFYQYIKNLPGIDGMINGKYDYNKNAWKFTRKVFAQWDVLKEHKGKVFWLDADIETAKKVKETWLESLFGGKCLSYLGREGFYTETGFVGFDTEHPDFEEFLHAYISCLQKGTFLTLKRWHDCEIFDHARKGISGNNLSPFYEKGKLDVFPKSVLGKFMLHFKGNRKRLLKTH